MNSEENRRKTFRNAEKSYSIDLVDQLAKDGFCYDGQSVACVFCGNLLQDDNLIQDNQLPDVRALHEKFKDCRFVKGEDVRNSPITEDPRRKKEDKKVVPESTHGSSPGQCNYTVTLHASITLRF